VGETIGKFVIGLEGLFFLVCLVILIFLIFRRIKIRKEENFEKREN